MNYSALKLFLELNKIKFNYFNLLDNLDSMLL